MQIELFSNFHRRFSHQQLLSFHLQPGIIGNKIFIARIGKKAQKRDQDAAAAGLPKNHKFYYRTICHEFHCDCSVNVPSSGISLRQRNCSVLEIEN